MPSGRMSRRGFLRSLAGAALSSAAGSSLAGAATRPVEEALPPLATMPTIGPVSQAAKSVVADVRAAEVIAGLKLHEQLVLELIEEGLQIATGTRSARDAWHKLIKPDDVVAVKFNHVGARELRTNEVFAAQMVASLGRAGIAPERIMLVEVPPSVARNLKTRPCVFGWSGGKVSFGSGEEELAAFLQEVTAIVNVPFMKTHNIAGMSGCLKNLSHALIRRPALYHADACSPFVGDILALPQIRSKLRVHVVNAIRAVMDGGPEPSPDSIWPHGGVLVSTDPVAADSVALEIINEQRAGKGLEPVGGAQAVIPHVRAAAARGLGTDDQDYIDWIGPRRF